MYLVQKKPGSDGIYYKDVLEAVGKVGGFHYPRHYDLFKGIEESESDEQFRMYLLIMVVGLGKGSWLLMD
jgi:hypothetical protein